MKIIKIFILTLIIPNLCWSATLELSTSGRKIGIGTTSTLNTLSIKNNLAVGSSTYTSTTAPTNGIIVEGNVGIGSTIPEQPLAVTGIIISDTLQTRGSAVPTFTSINSNGFGFDVNNNAVNDIVMDSNGNVGISSVTPSQKLDVTGTAQMTGFQLPTGAASGYVLTSNSVGVGTWQPASSGGGGGSGTVTSSTVNQVARFSATGTTVAGSTNLMSDNTNVGISTTVPTAKLQVNNNALPFVVDSSSRVGIGTNVVNNAALTVMNGNIGIGTWIPDSLLSINNQGSSQLAVANSTVHITGVDGNPLRLTLDTFNSVSTFGGLIDSRRARGTAVAPTAVLSGDTLLDLGVKGYGASQYSVNDVGKMTILAAEDFTNTANGTSMNFKTTPTGSVTTAERVRITASGNIGIGTSKPINLLEVNSTDSGTTITSASAAMQSVTNINTTNNTFSDMAFCQANASNAIVCTAKVAGVQTAHTAASESGELAFVTTGTGTAAERMRITSAGNVGIGSVTPGKILDINGTARATAFIGDGSGLTAVTAGGWTLGASNVGISTTNNVGIGTNLTTTAGLSVMAGNVGIGTWIPSTIFEIGSRKFNVLSGGNVGINSISPGQALDVQGIGRFSNNNTASIRTNDTSGNGNGIEFYNSGAIVADLEPNGTAGGTNRQFFLNLSATTSGADNWIGYRFNSSSRKWFFGDNGSSFFQTFNPMVFSVGAAAPSTSLATMPPELFISTSNVGIFTTTGGSKLSISGNASLGAYATIAAPNGGLIADGNIGIGTDMNGASGKLIVIGGNVGIGSIAPQATLDLGTSGTLRSNRTTGIGFTLKSGANTACNTTCGSSACVFGEDFGTVGVLNSSIVSCTDASADNCICAGP